MPLNPGCFTPDEVSEAFIASTPLISQEIRDSTIQFPNWLRDVWTIEKWPLGAGTVLEQLTFRSQMPKIERGFDQWENVGNVQGCDPCDGPDCAYHWTMFGGHAFDSQQTRMMKREFRTPAYCIAEIQTTHSFREVFQKIIQNIYRQTDYFKEMNIGLNFLTMLAKKFVVDSGGVKWNTNNPYVYPNIGTARLSTLNLTALEFFYESLRRIPDAVPYDTNNSAPIYALVASQQLLAALYRDDPRVREDLRFSSYANDLVEKYNFMSTIRGMYFAVPTLYPRRFNIVAGEPVEVLPFVNNVPAQVGFYTYPSPAYESATHEEVLIHGRDPFSIFVMESAQSLPGGATFGPEPGNGFMENWLWVNPQTTSDPFRREGYFASEAKLALSRQFSEGIYSWLVERPSTALMAMYTPNAVCPVDPPDCDNEIPDATCPCPMVMSIEAHPMTANNYFITFASPVTGTPGAPVQLALGNGAYVTGTLVAIDAAGLIAQFSFPAGLAEGACADIIGIYCDASLGCYSQVEATSDCRVGVGNGLRLLLKNPIKADTAGDVITAYFQDCTEANLQVVSVNLATLEWVVSYAAGFGPTGNPTGVIPDPDPTGIAAYMDADMLCDRGGVIAVCVPTTTDATCPSCALPTPVACV